VESPADKHTKALAAQVRSLVADYLGTICFAPDHAFFLDRIERLAALIASWGAHINLTAKPGDSRELAFHMIDSLMPVIFADKEEFLRHAFRVDSHVLDLGSGAGFPGLVLASALPANFTLIESRRKRASFLAIAAGEMGLKNVEVNSRRIKPDQTSLSRSCEQAQAKTHGHFDVVAARAFAIAPIFHSIAASALKPGGIAILYANPGQDLALPDAAQNGLHEFQPVAYTIPRGSRAVERILGLWRRATDYR
jgi:16S rRNA (guanine527-N7)-methyltransferase